MVLGYHHQLRLQTEKETGLSMYKILPYTDPATGVSVYLVVNKTTGKTEGKFASRKDAQAYVLSK